MEHIDFQEFRSLDAGLEATNKATYGILVYDEFDSTHVIIGTKEELKKMLADYGDDPLCRALGIEHRFRNRISAGIMDFALMNKRGLLVNNTYYDHKSVEKAMNSLMN